MAPRHHLDGGAGTDRLTFDPDGLEIDIADIEPLVDGIEEIDLGNTDNRLILDADSINPKIGAISAIQPGLSVLSIQTILRSFFASLVTASKACRPSGSNR